MLKKHLKGIVFASKNSYNWAAWAEPSWSMGCKMALISFLTISHPPCSSKPRATIR